MEHWDHRMCHAWSEVDFGSAFVLSACAIGVSIALAFGLGIA